MKTISILATLGDRYHGRVILLCSLGILYQMISFRTIPTKKDRKANENVANPPIFSHLCVSRVVVWGDAQVQVHMESWYKLHVAGRANTIAAIYPITLAKLILIVLALSRLTLHNSFLRLSI